MTNDLGGVDAEERGVGMNAPPREGDRCADEAEADDRDRRGYRPATALTLRRG